MKRYLKYAAIIVAFVLAGGTWWMVKENPEEIISVELSETSMLSPGTPKAYILFSSGQRMDLTTTGHDTMITVSYTHLDVYKRQLVTMPS